MHFYLRMDTTAFFFLFLHILFRRTTSLISIAFGKDLTGCASVMHNPFLLSGGIQNPFGRAVGFCISRRPPRRWLTRGQSSVADSIAVSDNDERRQESDYSRSVR